MIKKLKHLMLIFMTIVLFCGCGFDSKRGIDPDDELSASVCDSIGDTFRYLGQKQKPDDVIDYMYFAPYESLTSENISNFMNTVASLSVDNTKHIEFNICPQVENGYGGTCSLQNYIELSDDGDKKFIEFSEMCVYTITYQELSDPILTEPSTFIGVEGVKYLIISNRMQEKAEEEGIDWYEIWPDLEDIEIFYP